MSVPSRAGLRAVADLQVQVDVLLGALIRLHIQAATDHIGGPHNINPHTRAALEHEARAMWLHTARNPHVGDHETLRALGAGEAGDTP